MRTLGTLQGIAIRAASRAPMQEQQQVEVTTTNGIVQDYCGTGLRQVTLLDVGQWQEVLDALGIDLPWHTRRANLLIAGIDLSATVGRRLQIGTCRFAIDAIVANRPLRLTFSYDGRGRRRLAARGG